MDWKILQLIFFSMLLYGNDDFVRKFNEAESLIRKKEFDAAVKKLESIENKDNSKYLYQLGTLYCTMGNFKKCKKFLVMALKFENDDSRLLKNLNLLYKKKEGNKSSQKPQKSKKKSEIKKKFANQIKSFYASENKVFKKRFKNKISSKRFEKDW